MLKTTMVKFPTLIMCTRSSTTPYYFHFTTKVSVCVCVSGIEEARIKRLLGIYLKQTQNEKTQYNKLFIKILHMGNTEYFCVYG